VVVEYHDGTIEVIDDPYEIEKVAALLSIVTREQEQDIINFLNEVDKHE
jgi:hypothetical protein